MRTASGPPQSLRARDPARIERPARRRSVSRSTFLLLRRPPCEGMLGLLGRTTGGAFADGVQHITRSQMTLQTPRSFNSWLRSQLKEKKMSQRQLALQSGVDHSTISRLIKGDRMPSLGTATKLARGLREITDEADGPAYFASLNSRAVLPTTRVEYALRGDDVADRGRCSRADAGLYHGPPAPSAQRHKRLARSERLQPAELTPTGERPSSSAGSCGMPSGGAPEARWRRPTASRLGAC